MYVKSTYTKREKKRLYFEHTSMFQCQRQAEIWSRDAMTCKYKDEKKLLFFLSQKKCFLSIEYFHNSCDDLFLKMILKFRDPINSTKYFPR